MERMPIDTRNPSEREFEDAVAAELSPGWTCWQSRGA